jgi:hypothetical protein
MTEAEWQACEDPFLMLNHLQPAKGKWFGWLWPTPKTSDRKLRLFGVACCRRILDLMWAGCRPGIEASERFAEGLAGQEALKSAGLVCMHSRNDLQAARDAVEWILAGDSGPIDLLQPRQMAEAAQQSPILRDIVGNSFHPVTLNPSWLTSTVIALAQQMYETRDFSAMPILADALQDAGCDNEEMLQHCRGSGPHVRGCFVADLLLGKE